MAKNGTSETVPYTKRRHLVVMSYSREKELGDKYFEESKNSKYKGKIMPATHPQSVRVNQIANNIIDALKRGESEQALVELNWEFVVVDDPIVDASALAGGKIVVYTGLLQRLASDAEVAMIIAHEVGHVVARHQSEWRAYMEEFLVHMLKLRLTDSTVVALFVFFEDIVAARWLKWFPFIRLKEFEADHIGMILMASAGYDPRVALTMLEKFDGKVEAMPCRCNANRPSGKERIEMLARAKIMDEALTIYDAVLRPSSLHSPDQPQPK